MNINNPNLPLNNLPQWVINTDVVSQEISLAAYQIITNDNQEQESFQYALELLEQQLHKDHKEMWPLTMSGNVGTPISVMGI